MKRQASEQVYKVLDSYLETNGHRKTPERYAILDTIYGMKGHFTLQELQDVLDDARHFPVSRATLYNTMRLFIQLRLVVRHRFQGSTKYEACYNHKSHVHQVCTTCGKTIEVESATLTQAIYDLPLKRFHKDGFALYVYGICSTCQAKLTRQINLASKTKQSNQNKNKDK